MIEPLSKRVAAFGWHVQIYIPADRIAAAEDLWNRLPNTLVFDHLGHLPEPQGIAHPAYSVIRRLIDKGKTWVKLSGAYIDTKVGAANLFRFDQDRPGLCEGRAQAHGLG